jgi:hypothetical protein
MWFCHSNLMQLFFCGLVIDPKELMDIYLLFRKLDEYVHINENDISL